MPRLASLVLVCTLTCTVAGVCRLAERDGWHARGGRRVVGRQRRLRRPHGRRHDLRRAVRRTSDGYVVGQAVRTPRPALFRIRIALTPTGELETVSELG
jgi:hypothetical protein